MRIQIKPLSVNRAWQGKRYKTPEYKAYEKDVMALLRPMRVDGGKLSLRLRFGVSSKNMDIDNGVKPFVDILQKRYDFNDRNIYRLTIEKVDVAKGREFIEFDIEPMV